MHRKPGFVLDDIVFMLDKCASLICLKGWKTDAAKPTEPKLHFNANYSSIYISSFIIKWTEKYISLSFHSVLFVESYQHFVHNKLRPEKSF